MLTVDTLVAAIVATDSIQILRNAKVGVRPGEIFTSKIWGTRNQKVDIYNKQYTIYRTYKVRKPFTSIYFFSFAE